MAHDLFKRVLTRPTYVNINYDDELSPAFAA